MRVEGSDYEKELKVAIKASREAGEIVDRYQTEERIEIEERKAERSNWVLSIHPRLATTSFSRYRRFWKLQDRRR